MSVKSKIIATALLSSTLVACGGAPLDMSEAGYAEANECYAVLMAYTSLGLSDADNSYEDAPANASAAIKEIAAGIGIDDAKLQADAQANTDKSRALIAKGKADLDDAEFNVARDKAVKCGEIYG